jgi:hypothetical protein
MPIVSLKSGKLFARAVVMAIVIAIEFALEIDPDRVSLLNSACRKIKVVARIQAYLAKIM